MLNVARGEERKQTFLETDNFLHLSQSVVYFEFGIFFSLLEFGKTYKFVWQFLPRLEPLLDARRGGLDGPTQGVG